MHVYAEHISASSLEQLGLTKAEPGERVDVFVRQPRFPEAVFRGSVLAGGVPVADILQCWLDVAGHPARGAELAAEIWKQVLAPTLIDSHGRND